MSEPISSLDFEKLSVRFVRPLLSLIDDQKHSVSELLESVDLAPSLFVDNSARISQRKVLEIWKRVHEILQDDLMGVRAAQELPKNRFDALWYAFQTSENLLEAFRKLFRFHQLIHDSAEVGVEVRENEVILFFISPKRFEIPKSMVDFALSAWLKLARDTQGEDLHPLQVMMPYSRPNYHFELESHFQCPVLYECKRPEMHFHLKDMLKAMPEKDPFLASVIEQHVSSLLQALPMAKGFQAQVQTIIVENLCDPGMSASLVAKSLKLSERSFYRRLKEERLSFQDILDSVRYSSAQTLLLTTELPLAEISYLLGFSEISAFYRAFRRWSGVTPQQFRLQNS